MNIELVDIAKAAGEVSITTEPLKRRSITLDFVVMENGEIGILGITLKNDFSANMDSTFAGT